MKSDKKKMPAGPATAKGESSMDTTMRRLTDTVGQLEATVAILEQRLEDVLQPTEPNAAGKDLKGRSVSPLEQRIEDQCDVIQGFTHRLDNLLGRLAV